MALTALSGPAWAQDAAAIMPLGAQTAAPAGFLDYCARDVRACADAGEPASTEILTQRRLAANRLYWETVFGQSARMLSPAAAANESQPKAAPPRPIGSHYVVLKLPLAGRAPFVIRVAPPKPEEASSSDVPLADAAEDHAEPARNGVAMASGPGAASAADIGTSPTPLAAPQALLARPVFVLDDRGWALLNRVNRAVNRGIRRMDDAVQYGVDDFWTAPAGGRARGDCEDYVLAKRRDLIAAGVPSETLSIAVVETRRGEGHAVLVVAGDTGDFVLDSLSPWVERWDRVDYRWIARQGPGHAFEWRRIGA